MEPDANLSSTGPTLKSRVIRLFGGSLVILGVGKAVQLAMHAIMARQLGVSAFGQFSMALAICSILGLVLTLGLPTSGMRLAASYEGHGDLASLAGLLRFIALVALLAIAIAVAGSGVTALMFSDGEIDVIAWLTALILPLFVLALTREGVMRGLHELYRALAPREVFAPVLVIFVLMLVSPDTAIYAGSIFFAGYAAAEVLGAWYLWHRLPRSIWSLKRVWQPRQWLSISLPMQLAATARVALQRADLIFVGAMLGLEWAGIYAVAHRIAQVMNLIGRVSSYSISPLMARTYHVDDPKALLAIAKQASLYMLLIGLPAFAGVVVLAPWLVTLVGGTTEYADAATILIILAIGQLFNVLFNPIAQALLMSRFERVQLVIVSAAMIVALILYPVAITISGATGAATVTAVALVGINVASYWLGFGRLKQDVKNERD